MAKRFKLGELIKYRKLECYGTIWAKTKMPDGSTNYSIQLEENVDHRAFASDDGTLIEHL